MILSLIIIFMIFDLTSETKTNFNQKKKNWKEQFKAQLYAKNREVIALNKVKKRKERDSGLNAAIEMAGKKIFDMLQRQNTINIKDRTIVQTCHSYYSSFIPLKMQAKFDNELDITFPFLKYLEEKGRTNDRQNILNQIADHMHQMRQNRQMISGWKICLQKFICGIDTIRAIQIYLQFKKRGTAVLDELHMKYSNKCRKNVFFHRVCMAAKYFGAYKYQKTKPMSLSMQSTQEINEITMPKTMKMLFCSICLLYDCGRHSLDEMFKQKQYQYVSPKNRIDDQEKILSGINLCQIHQKIFRNQKISDQNVCSEKCYKKLDVQQWKILQKQRAVLMAPMVKGIIKIGIQMYGYQPCKICHLLVDAITAKGLKVTCSHVFLYFIDEYRIYSRLDKKLSQSQAEMLKREVQGDTRLPEPPKIMKNKNNKHKIQTNNQTNHHNFTVCGHYFVGQIPNDENCSACLCKQRGFCLPQCLCSSSCPLRKKGCNCKREDCRTKKCICYNQSRECSPELCSSCFTDRSKCRNNSIILRKFKKVRVGRSSVSGAGLGLFAAQVIQKDDMVMIYAGEVIQPCIDALRQDLRVDLSFYNFNSKEGIVDARFMGNLSRFINHGDGGIDNLQTQEMMSEGRYKIAFFANRMIDVGEELFFDYDGQGILYKNFKEKYPFIRSTKKHGSKNIKEK